MFQQMIRERPSVEATCRNPPFATEPPRPDIRLAPEPDDFDFEPDDHGDRAMGTSHDFEVEVEAIMKGLAASEDDRMKIAAYTPAIALGIAAVLAGIGLAVRAGRCASRPRQRRGYHLARHRG